MQTPARKSATQLEQTQSLTPLEAGLLLVAPLGCIAFVGCAYHALHMGLLVNTPLGPRGLFYSPYFTITSMVMLCMWCGLSRSVECAFTVLIGCMITLLAIFNFRGSFYWPGTFDAQAISPWHTFTPFILGICLGAAIARLRPVLGPHLLITLGLLLFGGVTWSWFDSKRDIGMYSLAPYSLHIAVSATCLVGAIVAILVKGATK